MRPVVWIMAFSALLIAGCELKPEKPVPLKKEASYRTLESYFKGEIIRLRNDAVSVEKIIRINSKTDTSFVKDSAGLEALFRPLMDADVSKPSMADGYHIDTIANQFSGDTTFIYRSAGKQSWPSQLIIDIGNNGQIKSASVSSITKNLVYEYRQEVLFERNRHLRISTFQKIVFLKPESLEIQAWFLPSTKNS